MFNERTKEATVTLGGEALRMRDGVRPEGDDVSEALRWAVMPLERRWGAAGPWVSESTQSARRV